MKSSKVMSKAFFLGVKKIKLWNEVKNKQIVSRLLDQC